jgi:dihydroflavonol-4-reductase
MSRPLTGAPVLVTGAAGFVGSQITQRLLEDGYLVRGTVRDPARVESEGHLGALSGASERLALIRADLLDANAFDQAVMGCAHVIHTASPYAVDVTDPQRDLVDPAVRGTRSLLEGCLREPTIKRVVLTSSAAGITDAADGVIHTEADWNTRSSLTRNPYYYAKTLAERAAWEFMDTRRPGFDLVVINPFYVIGPSLVPGVNTSHITLIGLTNGSVPAIVALPMPIVDVRDVARAHVLAMETPEASGRYLVAAGTRSLRQVVDLLRTNGWDERYRLPSLRLDTGIGVPLSRFVANFRPPGTRSYLKTHLGGQMRFDNSKVRNELGLEFRDVDQTILDTMEDLDRWGHLGKKR